MSSPPDKPEALAAGAGVVVRVFGRTDVGRAREHNEDAFLVADLRANEALTFDPASADVRTHEVQADRPAMLFMVADGLGGAAAGEVASRMAVQTVFASLRERVAGDSDDATAFATALRDATLAANEAIHQQAQRHRELHGMGTTVTAAALLGDTLYVSQVGDSRAYLIRDAIAMQITKDQSLMQKLVEAGEITPEQAEQSARRNIILQALGPETTVKIDLTHQPVRRGDLLLLCSDGLSGQVRAEEIGQLAREHAIDTLCERLIDLANDRGGPDNITVVVAHFDGEALTHPGDRDAVGHQVYPIAGMMITEEVKPAPRPRTTGTAPLPPAIGPDVPSPPLPAPARDPQVLAERRARARPVMFALAATALLIAIVLIWRMLTGR